MADVSVVIPTLDRTGLLARALARVLAQRDVDIEVLVIDDGSNPAMTSAPALGTLLADPRIRMLRHEMTRGVAAARNTGIAAATAPWLAFHDDDDLWATNKLAVQLEALSKRPECTWSYTGDVTLNDDLTVVWVTEGPPGDGIDLRLLQESAVPGGASSVLAAAELVREAGGFDESYSILADWDLWIRLAQLGCAAPVSEPLVGYVKHRQGMSFDTSRSLEEFGRIEEKYRSLRRAHDVEIDVANYLRYITDLECRAGRRWSAASHRFRIGQPPMSPRSLALTIGTLLSPGAFYKMRERQTRRLCAPASIAAAQRWLNELDGAGGGDLGPESTDGISEHHPRV
jgi:GT2 family glycosyltransferase